MPERKVFKGGDTSEYDSTPQQLGSRLDPRIQHQTDRGSIMETEKECYGRIFPSVAELHHNSLVGGRVFGYKVECTGISTGDRTVVTDLQHWRECICCSKFSDCYQLSVGQLLMEIAIRPSGSLR